MWTPTIGFCHQPIGKQWKFRPQHSYFLDVSWCFPTVSAFNSLFGHWTIFPPSANMGNLYQEPKFTLRKRFPCSIHPRREKHVPWKTDPLLKEKKHLPTYPPRKKGFIRLQGKPMVNKPLIRPYLQGGTLGGVGWLAMTLIFPCI